MENNYLITGYWGEPHVTSENDRGINAAVFGTGRFVLPVGRQFNAEYIGNNTIRIYDGKLVDNGAVAGIPAGDYIDLLVANASQGKKRNDLIVFQYSQDAGTLVERGTFIVVQGDETNGTPVDPELTQADLLSGNATFDQMALWRVSVSGVTIAAPQKLFGLSENLAEHADMLADIISGNQVVGTANKANIATNVRGEQLNTSVLQKATGLADGVYDYRLNGDSYTGGDMPSSVQLHGKYSTVTVFKRGTGAVVMLWGAPNCPTFRNVYDGTAWSGWEEFITTATIADQTVKKAGQADWSLRATQDVLGNVISNYYATFFKTWNDASPDTVYPDGMYQIKFQLNSAGTWIYATVPFYSGEYILIDVSDRWDRRHFVTNDGKFTLYADSVDGSTVDITDSLHAIKIRRIG